MLDSGIRTKWRPAGPPEFPRHRIFPNARAFCAVGDFSGIALEAWAAEKKRCSLWSPERLKAAMKARMSAYYPHPLDGNGGDFDAGSVALLEVLMSST